MINKIICIKSYVQKGSISSYSFTFLEGHTYEYNPLEEVGGVIVTLYTGEYRNTHRVGFNITRGEFYEHFKILKDYREEQIDSLLANEVSSLNNLNS
jgi:hypothetical protein